MINSFFFKYNYLGIIQEYFQPKIGRKKAIFSLGQENNIVISKKERGCIKLKKLELKLIKDSVLFLTTFSQFPSRLNFKAHFALFLSFMFYTILSRIFVATNFSASNNHPLMSLRGMDLALCWDPTMRAEVSSWRCSFQHLLLKFFYLKYIENELKEKITVTIHVQ